MNEIKEFDVVVLTVNLPEHGLRRGEVGSVVQVFAATSKRAEAYLVEFCDKNGVTYAITPLRAEQVMALYYKEAA